MDQREVLLTIAGMALVTYLTRVSGFILLSRITRIPPRIEAWMKYLPGSILLALTAPTVVTLGTSGIIAGCITALVALRTKQLLWAMLAGIVAIWLLRLVIPG